MTMQSPFVLFGVEGLKMINFIHFELKTQEGSYFMEREIKQFSLKQLNKMMFFIKKRCRFKFMKILMSDWIVCSSLNKHTLLSYFNHRLMFQTSPMCIYTYKLHCVHRKHAHHK